MTELPKIPPNPINPQDPLSIDPKEEEALTPINKEKAGGTVSSGYDTENTLSYLKAPKKDPLLENIEDILVNNNLKLDAKSYLSLNLINRVESFQKTLIDFNKDVLNQYKGDTLALLNSGSSLIMLLNGSLDGFKMIKSFNSVLSNGSIKENKLTQEKKRSAVKQKIKTLDKTIEDLNVKKTQQNQQINLLYNQIDNKENELNNLNNTQDNTRIVTELQKEIDDLYSKSNNLLLSLNNTNQQLEHNDNNKNQNINQHKFLNILIGSLDSSTNNIINLLKESGINSRYHLNQLAKKLEKKADEIKEKNIENIEKVNNKNKVIQEPKLVEKELDIKIRNEDINKNKVIQEPKLVKKDLDIKTANEDVNKNKVIQEPKLVKKDLDIKTANEDVNKNKVIQEPKLVEKNLDIKIGNEDVNKNKVIQEPKLVEKNLDIKIKNEDVNKNKVIQEPKLVEKNSDIKTANEDVNKNKVIQEPKLVEKNSDIKIENKDVNKNKVIQELKLEKDLDIKTVNEDVNKINNLLNKKFLHKILTVFSPSLVPAIQGSEDNNSLPENIQQPIGLILSAMIKDKELAHKQPHLGDSITLEGADNPVAYGLVLLKYNMEQLQQNIINTEHLYNAEQQEQELMQQMLNLQNNVDLIVLNSLNQTNTPDVQRRIHV